MAEQDDDTAELEEAAVVLRKIFPVPDEAANAPIHGLRISAPTFMIQVLLEIDIAGAERYVVASDPSSFDLELRRD
jgi:hypothetical protein